MRKSYINPNYNPELHWKWYLESLILKSDKVFSQITGITNDKCIVTVHNEGHPIVPDNAMSVMGKKPDVVLEYFAEPSALIFLLPISIKKDSDLAKSEQDKWIDTIKDEKYEVEGQKFLIRKTIYICPESNQLDILSIDELIEGMREEKEFYASNCRILETLQNSLTTYDPGAE